MLPNRPWHWADADAGPASLQAKKDSKVVAMTGCPQAAWGW